MEGLVVWMSCICGVEMGDGDDGSVCRNVKPEKGKSRQGMVTEIVLMVLLMR